MEGKLLKSKMSKKRRNSENNMGVGHLLYFDVPSVHERSKIQNSRLLSISGRSYKLFLYTTRDIYSSTLLNNMPSPVEKVKGRS